MKKGKNTQRFKYMVVWSSVCKAIFFSSNFLVKDVINYLACCCFPLKSCPFFSSCVKLYKYYAKQPNNILISSIHLPLVKLLLLQYLVNLYNSFDLFPFLNGLHNLIASCICDPEYFLRCKFSLIGTCDELFK